MRSRTLGAVFATCAVAVPASAEAQPPSPAPPAPDVTAAQPGALAPPAPGIVAARPPSDIVQVRERPLLKRNLRLEGRRQSLLGERLGRSERDRLGAGLLTMTPRRLRARTRRLERAVRALRPTVERQPPAADIAIPLALDSIARCESGGDPRAVSPSGDYRGKYQFDYGTWGSVGGKGDPASASETEQDRRAAVLYGRSGATPWPVCGS